jgi:hypothetical protein
VWLGSPKLFEEKDDEGHDTCMQNPHRWIVLDMLFPTIGGMSCGSSWLRIFSLLMMNPRKQMKKPHI